MLTCSAAVIVLLGLTFSPFATGHGQRVETVLSAKWKPTSILSEAGEFISDLDPILFWKYVDAVFGTLESFPVPPADGKNL